MHNTSPRFESLPIMEFKSLKGITNLGRQPCWEKLGNQTVEAMAMQLYLRPHVLNVGAVLQGWLCFARQRLQIINSKI